MKNEDILLIVLLVIAIGGLLFAVLGFKVFGTQSSKQNTKTDNSLTGSSSSSLNSISTGTTGPGDVSVELTPHEASNGKLVFDVSVNTHSVDIGKFDLMKITTLEYDGKSIGPSSAPSLDGHHASGELVFDVEEDISSFTVKIKGIPKVNERVFEWK